MRRSLGVAILFLFLLSSISFSSTGFNENQANFNTTDFHSTETELLKETSTNIVNKDSSDIELKSHSISSDHYYTEPITLFVDNLFLSETSGRIQKVDFYDKTDFENPVYLGSSKWNEATERWELEVNFDEPGLKAISAEIETIEGYITQTSSLIRINDEIQGEAGGYYSAIFGSDSISELGYEGNSGHFEGHGYEIFLGVDAEIQLDVQLHEVTKAYYDPSINKWGATGESIVRLTAETYRIHGIIYHELPGNLFRFEVSDLDVGDYINFGAAGYRWFGDPNDDYVYMHNKETTFAGSYCIGMKIDIDLDLSAWTDDGNSWSTGDLDYRLLWFGFKTQAADLTVVASALAEDYYLQVFDREPPTMEGPIVDDIIYYYGGSHVTSPEYLKNSVKFRADFTPIEGIPGTGTHEYRWRLDSDAWSDWTPTSNDYGVSPWFNKGSSGSSLVTFEVKDTYFENIRSYGEYFRWDYISTSSDVNYDNLVKSSSSSLNDITSGILELSEDYANPIDIYGCGVDRTEDIWMYRNVFNTWQTIGTGDGVINWNVNNLPDADPGYQMSYYTEDRLGNGDSNTAIWIKTNNKGPVLYEGASHFSGSYMVGDNVYVHETTDWIVAAYDNVGAYERDDEIQSMYFRIVLDNPFPFPDTIIYETTLTSLSYIYTIGGHKVFTTTIHNLFNLTELAGEHDQRLFLDFQLYDGLGKTSPLTRYGEVLIMDYEAEHHGAEITLSNVSPTYINQSVTYISGITRLGVTGNDPDIANYEWFVDSTSLATTTSNYYDLDTTTLTDGANYNFKVKVTDLFGNTFTSAVTQQYTVDNTIPNVNITSLHDNDILKGTVSLEWTTDFADIQDAFWQYRYWDGLDWISWQNITDSDSDFYNPLLWDTSSLPEYSTYEIQIIVVDQVSLTATDVVGQITIDNVYPTILGSSVSFTYELGSINNSLFYNVTDLSPSFYRVYRDSAFLYESNWTNIDLIEISVDGLDVGTYSYYLEIHDNFDNNVTSSEVIVTVEDTTAPVVTQPEDVSYIVGSTGNTITWIGTDLKPAAYLVYLNDVYQFGRSYSSGQIIVVNIDGLSEGNYTYEIVFYDIYSNTLSDFVNVTVLPDIDVPSLIEQEDVFFELGDVGFEIDWNAQDINPDNYILYINDVNIQAASWSNGVPITVDLDGHELGEYIYKIEFYDLYNNMITDEVLVVVVDTTLPELLGPSDRSYEEGSLGNVLSWVALDLKPDNYILYINGTSNKTGVWTNSEDIVFNIDGWSQGMYNYTLIVFDTSGNYMVDEVLITVTEKTEKTSGYTIFLALMTISLMVFILRKKKRN